MGSLWAYVRLDAPDYDEELKLLSGVFPQLLPLLPFAVSLLVLVQQAAGHVKPTPYDPSCQSSWCSSQAIKALEAAGLKHGGLDLHLPRHFSIRDLFKFCHRMEVGIKIMSWESLLYFNTLSVDY